MAAIASINVSGQIGSFDSAESTLSSSDTITVAPGKLQLLSLRNATAGTLTLVIDGADGTTVAIPGYGTVSVASGYSIVLAAGVQKSVVLSSISMYLQGVVTLTGASGVKVQLFDI